MLTKLSTYTFCKQLTLAALLLTISIFTTAQTLEGDSLKNRQDSLLSKIEQDSTALEKKKSSVNLEVKAIYEAEDSIIMDKANQKAYLYHNAILNYDGIILTAEYIELDFKNNTVYAIGLADSTGKIAGNPVFNDNGDEYEAAVIRYNFETKKGLISGVTKEEGEMFVWMGKGKKMSDNITYVESGHFTTCDAEHPHYRVRFQKGKVIPNDKIVTGPIYLEIEDIPIPLFVPFGFIPNSSKRSNGLLFPSYGYSENRGYNLTDLGYYWGLGPNVDLALRSDIYSRGSWGIKALSRYNFRYKGNGSLNVKYAYNKYGETDTENYNEDQSFFVRWQHRQDPKANPYSSFSANVNFGSTEYNRLNSTNTADYLTNTFQSSVSYNARIGNGYNFTGSLNHSQNTQTGAVNLTLPQLAFSTPRFTPFERRNAVGPKRWYEKISISYKADSKNTLNTVDSLFGQTQWKDFQRGIQHIIPINSTVSAGNFNWTNTVNVKERWYFETTHKYWESDTIYEGTDTIAPHSVTETVDGFKAAHEFDFSSKLSTRIYGMYMMKNGSPTAMRHVLTPKISFKYRPDFGDDPFNYYEEYVDGNGDTIRYSIFEGQMYGYPQDGKSGSVGLSFDNNFELKVRSKKDTIKGTKKIKLIESLRIATAYNIAAEEFALAPLALTARTTLFKGLSIRYAAYWDFYGRDSTGQRINEFNWNLGNPILHKDNSSWNFGFNYQVGSNTINEKRNKKTSGGTDRIRPVDFNNDWQLNLNYKYDYKTTYNASQDTYENKTVHTLGLRGNVNITESWKVGATTGWDFRSNQVSYTSIDIYRDLHCWELLFKWIPSGIRKSYNLTIRIKASMLQDVKFNRKRDWRDY